MKKNIIFIIIVCLIILSPGCINNNNNKDNNDEENKYKCKYWYQIEINCTSGHYDLNVPLPVYSDENRIIHISPIINELKVVIGNALFEIENTSFGPSLKITGKGYVIINLSGNDILKYKVNNQKSRLFLSMALDKDNDGYYDDEFELMKYRIYCHQNLTLNITINFDYRKGTETYSTMDSSTKIQNEIKQGWNKVNGTFFVAIS